MYRYRYGFGCGFLLSSVVPSANPLNICGPKLRALRVERGLSQPALAAMCQRAGWDITREVIAKIEGKTRSLRDFEIKKIADVLDVPITALF